MNKSIENIWKDGFINEKLEAPKINDLYNQKSINMVEKIIKGFEREVLFLIPITIFIFLFNIWLDNDNAMLWGMISAIPCLFWFYLGKKQIKSLARIDYQANCYQYLLSIKDKLTAIHSFNKKLAISSVPITLFPMLIYTYFNQRGKTLGEIFGWEWENVNLPTVTIFLLVPILTFVAYLIAELSFGKHKTKKIFGIDTLIKEMEELKN